MQRISRILAAIAMVLPLGAQDSTDASIDAAIHGAQTAKSPATLEDRAAKLEAGYHYDSAQKLLNAALALRGQLDGDQSAEYGLCLLKVGALERKTGHPKEAAAHYAEAVRLLPGRPETAPVFLYLAIAASGAKSPDLEAENLEKARSLDGSLTGPVLMWTALMHERQGQVEPAEAAYKSALAAEGSDSMETFETLTLYGRFLAEHGRDSEAALMKTRANAIGSGRREPLASTKGAPMPKLAPIAGVYRVGGSVSAPTIVSKTDPPYSEEARVAKYSATVVLQLVVGVDGSAQDIKVVRAAGFGLDDCAVSTLAQWRFNPGQKDGSAVPVFATVQINFRLL
jgi:TonB family protein